MFYACTAWYTIQAKKRWKRHRRNRDWFDYHSGLVLLEVGILIVKEASTWCPVKKRHVPPDTTKDGATGATK
jgi:hypothetical protein